MANLRLDETEGLFVDRGGYKIIVPCSSAQSKLYEKISSNDPEFHMPPVSSNRKLTDQLTYKFQGRHFRLTDIAGNVITQALA